MVWPVGDRGCGDRPVLAASEGDRGGSREGMADGDMGEFGWPNEDDANAVSPIMDSVDDEPSCCRMSCSAVSAADCEAPRRRLGMLPMPMPYVERCTGLPRRVEDAEPELDDADDMMPAATELDSPTALLLLRIGWATANDWVGEEAADDDGSRAEGGVMGFEFDDDEVKAEDEVADGGAGDRVACEAMSAGSAANADTSPVCATTKGDAADATGSAAALHEKPPFCCGVEAAPLAPAAEPGVLNPIVDRLTMTGDEVEVDGAPLRVPAAPMGVAGIDWLCGGTGTEPLACDAGESTECCDAVDGLGLLDADWLLLGDGTLAGTGDRAVAAIEGVEPREAVSAMVRSEVRAGAAVCNVCGADTAVMMAGGREEGGEGVVVTAEATADVESAASALEAGVATEAGAADERAA